jgi:hypothetical protein
MFEWMMDGCRWMVGWMNDNSVQSRISNRVIYFSYQLFCVCVCVFGFALLSLSLIIMGKKDD